MWSQLVVSITRNAMPDIPDQPDDQPTKPPNQYNTYKTARGDAYDRNRQDARMRVSQTQRTASQYCTSRSEAGKAKATVACSRPGGSVGSSYRNSRAIEFIVLSEVS